MSGLPDGDGTWSFGLATRLVAGPGCVRRLGELLEGRARCLVVTDPGVAAAGHAATVEQGLASAGIASRRFEGVHENPTTEDVEACLAVLTELAPEVVVAVGGGSSIDTAKGAILLRAGGGRLEEYWVKQPVPRRPEQPLLPLVAVPTTAGTGSEVQSHALVADARTHAKMALGHPDLAPRLALLDPDLTRTQPPRVAACTGLDALTHAVEAAVSRASGDLALLCAREAFARCVRHLPAVLAGRADAHDRQALLVGAALAGVAIENDMLGAAHSMANPLTAHHGVPHGQAVATALPHVVRFNAIEPRAAERYLLLARAAGLVGEGAGADEAAERIAATVEALLDAAGFPRSLGALGVGEGDLPRLAAEAASQWTAGFNPRPVEQAELLGLYAAAR